MRLLLALSLFSFSGWGAPAPKYLTLKKIAPVALSEIKSGEIKVIATVDKGMHVQSNPAGAPNLKPTRLEIASQDGLELKAPIYPTGTPHVLQAVGNIPAYEGTFEIKVPIKVLTGAKPQRLTLEGTLYYQACNETVCFFPMHLPVSVPVSIQ